MATTRSRAGTSRSKKSAKTTTTKEEQPRDSTVTAGGSHAVPEVTGTMLERREIPSFSESREARIAEAAYWRAERRGFIAGHELDDWLEAEKEIDREIAGRDRERP